MSDAVRTTCPYCGVGCGVIVERAGDGFAVRGDPDHPANRGELCAKGAALAETLGTDWRLLHPEIHGRRVSWDAALDFVAAGLRETLATHGPGAIAFYVSGQLLTEDYYVANKLMKGFIGSANIDTNSRLCMASPTAAHQRAFGEDLVPVTYADLDEAELIVMAGWNGAFTHPVLFRRIEAARRRGCRLIVIDPRRTASAEVADLHLALLPGSDLWLWNGLLEFLKREDALDWRFLEEHVANFGVTLEAVAGLSIPEVARRCGVREADVADFYRAFRDCPRTVTVFSQGVNQSVSGTDTGNAIINVHLATGRIGRPGAGPFAVTGQPNAMGGREVGGLATQLAAHRDFSPKNRARVQGFWGAPRMAEGPGLTAVDLFEAVHAGRIRALWIMATNPVVSLPDADRVREALERCPLVIVSDMAADGDTVRLAHVRLPAAGWGEKDGTVTNSERRISRQRPFRAPVGEARPDWWMVCEVAKRLGWGEAFAYDGPHAIFREHAALTALDAEGPVLRLDHLCNLDRAAYDALEPTLWPAKPQLFGDGRFATADGRARMLPVQAAAPPLPAAHLLLNTGRVRDQWHTLTRTGRVARLFAHTPEPFLAVHPEDARRLGLSDGGFARVDNAWGQAVLRVRVDSGQQPGSVFVPMHWGEAFATGARVNALVAPELDPVSRQPAFKSAAVQVTPALPRWQAVMLVRAMPSLPPGIHWHRVPVPGGVRLELAAFGKEPACDRLPALIEGPGETLQFSDPGVGRLRRACLAEGRLSALLYVEPGNGRLPSRAWLDTLLALDALDAPTRAALLSGRPPSGVATGPVICACRGVTADAIAAAIAAGADTVEAIGERLGAGTGCGACVPEIRTLIAGRSRVAA